MKSTLWSIDELRLYVTERVLRVFYLLDDNHAQFVRDMEMNIDTSIKGTEKERRVRGKIAQEVTVKIANIRLEHSYDTSSYKGKYLKALENTPNRGCDAHKNSEVRWSRLGVIYIFTLPFTDIHTFAETYVEKRYNQHDFRHPP